MCAEKSFGRRCRQEGKRTSCHTGWHSIYTTHECLESLNKIACVITRDCTPLAHNSCHCGVSHLEKQPHPFWVFCFFHNNVDVTIPVRCTLKMHFICTWVLICSILLVWISFQTIHRVCAQARLHVISSSFPFLFCLLRSERAGMMCRGNNTGQSLFLCLSFSAAHPLSEYLSQRAFMRIPQVCHAGGLCSVGVQNKTGGQDPQIHFPIPARPEYDLISPTACYHSRDLWYARWWANSWWVCVRDMFYRTAQKVTVTDETIAGVFEILETVLIWNHILILFYVSNLVSHSAHFTLLCNNTTDSALKIQLSF